MTANGGGILIGSFLSGIGTKAGARPPRPDGAEHRQHRRFGGGALTLVHTTLTGAALLACVGLLSGIMQIALFTWIQQRVSQEMMGRTMSV